MATAKTGTMTVGLVRPATKGSGDVSLPDRVKVPCGVDSNTGVQCRQNAKFKSGNRKLCTWHAREYRAAGKPVEELAPAPVAKAKVKTAKSGKTAKAAKPKAKKSAKPKSKAKSKTAKATEAAAAA